MLSKQEVISLLKLKMKGNMIVGENEKGKVHIASVSEKEFKKYYDGEMNRDKAREDLGFAQGWMCTVGQSTIISAVEEMYDEGDIEKKDIKVDGLDKVILQEGHAEKIVETISQIQNKEKIMIERGLSDILRNGSGVNMLFHGHSGTGKTYCGEVIADMLGVECEIVSMGSIGSKWLGETEKNVLEMFTKIGNKVLILDECDTFLTSRGEQTHIHSEITNQFLQGLERHNGVVICTTNRPIKIDKAVERRMDLILKFDPPNKDMRKRIRSVLVPSKLPVGNIDRDVISEYELHGGQIKNCIVSCARMMAFHEIEVLTQEMLIESIEHEILEMEEFVGDHVSRK